MVILINEGETKEKLREIYKNELFPDATKNECNYAVEIMYENYEGKKITTQVFEKEVTEKVKGILLIMKDSPSQ